MAQGETNFKKKNCYLFECCSPNKPMSSRAFTTRVDFQRFGKCRVLPVTRYSAAAASAHSKKRLSGSSLDSVTSARAVTIVASMTVGDRHAYALVKRQLHQTVTAPVAEIPHQDLIRTWISPVTRDRLTSHMARLRRGGAAGLLGPP